MAKFAITLSACATVFIEAEDYTEAEDKALDDFEKGKEALIYSIDTNGYEAEYDSGLTEEYNED